MERQDIRIERSRQAIQSALLCLMREKEYDAITVKDLAEKAMINRKTFYAHYEGKEALFMAMMHDMFDEIFCTFMYPKPNPAPEVDVRVLEEDIRAFLRTVERYREELEVMITDQTSELAFAVAERIILNRARDIRLITADVPGRVPVQIYLIRIKSFFLMMIDWWLEQKECGLEEAVAILSRSMRKDTCSLFRYHRSQGSEPGDGGVR